MENRSSSPVQHSNTAPAPVIDLLKRTLIGTSGSLYQLLDTPVKIHRLDHPHFFYIERQCKAIGTITICERPVSINGLVKPGLYIRYFAFDPAFQGSGLARTTSRNSVFDRYWKKLLDSGELPGPDARKGAFFWAFIDPQNLRSFNVNERFGFETIGAFNTIAFSRFFPRKDPNVHPIDPSEKPEVLDKIRAFYNDYVFFSDAHLFEDNHFFVYKENGRIVAGVQVHPARYRIVSLPGWQGKVLVNLLPYTVLMKRIINPREHRFLATEGIFWQPGHEDKVEKMLSGILALTGYYSLLLWEDKKSTRMKSLPIRWGTLQRMKKDNEILVVARIINDDPATSAALRSQPAYLSGFDMT